MPREDHDWDQSLGEEVLNSDLLTQCGLGMPIEMGTDVGKKPRHPGQGQTACFALQLNFLHRSEVQSN